MTDIINGADAAFFNQGEEAYWERLSMGCVVAGSAGQRSTAGNGYSDPPSAHQAHVDGTGHASDVVQPLDQIFKS